FNRKIGDAVAGWAGFSGWYAFAWLALVALYAFLVSHHKIVSARDGRIAALQSTVTELQAVPTPHLRFVGVDIDRDARLQIHIIRSGRDRGIAPVRDPMTWARVLVANDPGDAT